MKVVCINNQRENVEIEFPKYIHPYLTIGKVYEVISSVNKSGRPHAATYDDWLIEDDDSNGNWYKKTLFVTLEEYRQIKLEQLI